MAEGNGNGNGRKRRPPQNGGNSPKNGNNSSNGNNGAAKGSGGEEKKNKQAAPEQKLSSGALRNEKNQFWSIVLFAVGVLVFLMAVIKGSAGWNGIHNGLLGIFSLAVFFVPVVLIYTAVLIGMEKSQKCVAGRAVWGIAIIILASAAVQIFSVGKLPGEGFFNNIAELYKSGKELKGGGVAGFIIAGPLLSIFGTTGSKIISVIMFFVFSMLLTGLGLIQFLELITRPFKFIGRCFMGFRNVISGGDFEDAFDDDDEKNDFEADIEAINLVNNRRPPRKRQKSSDNAENGSSEQDFLIDIPLPGEKPEDRSAEAEETAAEAAEAAPEAPENTESSGKEKSSGVYDGLSELISQAVDELDKKNSETQSESELIPVPQEEIRPQYVLPSLDLLTPPEIKSNGEEASFEMREKAEIIVNTLKSFGVTVRISDIYRGPSITRYEIQPGAGVKVSKIKGLEDDIALYLAAQGVRIEAPVPGKAAVGIEVPNTKKDMVTLREILASQDFRNSKSKLTFAVGKDIAGKIILGDVAKMPHVIIAGTTGSGKSVCTRSIIMSILYNATPDEVKLILIDPKIVEFKIFEGLPHLLIPIVTDSKKAAGALNWAVNEMMRRYQMFAEDGANDIKSYNEMADSNDEVERIPQIVIFIDELADMMLVAGKEVEDSICRLAQMGRAAGMHLVVATQRPTTDVITGLIKANIPSRIALSVMSQVDSRTIIDMAGADKLLGNGDMLYMPIGSSKPVRVQGCFASTKDIENTVSFIKSQAQGEFDSEIIEAVESLVPVSKNDKDDSSESSYAAGSDEDYVERAMAVAVDNGQLSTSMLQRKLKLGYARAARIMDELEELGVIGPSEGAKPRKVLITRMQLDERRARMNEKS